MADFHKNLESLFALVEKPSRYIGGEYHSIKKDPTASRLGFALCYPDLYEIGMSHLGIKILYHLLNSDQEIIAERFFAPWIDMRAHLKKRGIPLLSLEHGRPLKEFDIIGFSLQYELNYTNVLTMLDLGGIPIKSSDRKQGDPIILAGGPTVFNPEPMADFIDLFVIGDGEEIIMEIVDLFKKLMSAGVKREDMIRRAATLEGIYAPGLYELRKGSGGFQIPHPVNNAPMKIKRRILKNLEDFPFPENTIIPHCEIIHDRVSYEIMRGCLTGCRFCQAGYVYRPRRERSHESIRKGIIRSVHNTGYEEVSLTSLNSGEYGKIEDLLQDLMDDFSRQYTFLSLPSLKPSSLSEGIVKQIKRGRKTGFTIAPEAGTERLRKVINKNITREDIMRASELAFREGWTLLKLYFMIGLPTEDEKDISEMVDLIREISKRGRYYGNRRGRINVSISSFIPKPHTPFQWIPAEKIECLIEKQKFIKDKLSKQSIKLKWHNVRMSFLEAVLARGDRALSPVIERAFHAGCAFDGWSDQFDFSKWENAFRSCGVNPSAYAYRAIGMNDPLPWDIIETGVSKEFLVKECEKALSGEMTEICRQDLCHMCGTIAGLCKSIMASADSKGNAFSTPMIENQKNDHLKPQYRYRAKYEKKGKMRFLSHLDMARTVIRGLRRADIPIIYTRGFHPKPKISFGPALTLGIQSTAEYLDFYSHQYLHEDIFLEHVNKFLTEGLRFTKLKRIPKSTSSLSESLNLALYKVRLGEREANDLMKEKTGYLKARLGGDLGSSLNEKRIQEILRSINKINRCEDNGLELWFHMRKGENVKVGDILKMILNRDDWVNFVERTEMFIEKDGKIFTPFMIANNRRFYVKGNDH